MPRNCIQREAITTPTRLQNKMKRTNIASVAIVSEGDMQYVRANTVNVINCDGCDSVQMYDVLVRPAVVPRHRTVHPLV